MPIKNIFSHFNTIMMRIHYNLLHTFVRSRRVYIKGINDLPLNAPTVLKEGYMCGKSVQWQQNAQTRSHLSCQHTSVVVLLHFPH